VVASTSAWAVCLVPKPLQRPHPPIRIAATTQDTYPMVGRMGYPVFLAVRTSSISELTSWVGSYHEAWKAAGHPGRGEVGVIVPAWATPPFTGDQRTIRP
jgi:alkanesulfonate monooxygenase SsuD/methylene tetrahydromethanopterin reductase-like flavin-dependent oxidoreductase (luciferase family)